MKEKFKLFLKWLVWFVICFAVIYLIVFLGGWKLFKSRDPILIELGAALILSIFVFAVNETVTNLEKRVKALENQLAKNENKN